MTTGSEQSYPDYIGRNQKAWSDRDSDYAATTHAKWAGEAAWGQMWPLSVYAGQRGRAKG
jgi:hypothetical protein